MSAKILAVDDSCSMRQMVRAALEADGYPVREAQNGQEALESLEAESVDLVITDLYMPTMDGLTRLKHVRQRPRHCFLPVLLLTTENGDEMKQRSDLGGHRLAGEALPARATAPGGGPGPGRGARPNLAARPVRA